MASKTPTTDKKSVASKTVAPKKAAVKKSTPIEKGAEKAEIKVVKKAPVSARGRLSSGQKKEVKQATVSVDVLDIKGKADGKIAVSGEIFAASVNPNLMAQAVRVYLANQRQGTLRTKSRGEVQGSTRKIYRQKGTGRARHGGITAPIFVGGGIAHGPKPRDYSMNFPKKMKKAALFSALTSKLHDKQIKVVSGFEKVPAKTKDMAQVMKALGLETGSVLFLTNANEHVTRSAKNIKSISLLPATQVNTYQVLAAQTVVIMKEALDLLEKNFITKE